jgi:hypothetical protein
MKTELERRECRERDRWCSSVEHLKRGKESHRPGLESRRLIEERYRHRPIDVAQGEADGECERRLRRQPQSTASAGCDVARLLLAEETVDGGRGRVGERSQLAWRGCGWDRAEYCAAKSEDVQVGLPAFDAVASVSS